MSIRKRRTIFDIFYELQNEISRMVEEVLEPMLSEAPLYDISRRELQPLAKILVTDDNVVVMVDLPCVKKGGIKVDATDDMVKIEAQMTQCFRFSPCGPVQREFDIFRKNVTLPITVDPKKARAKFKEGILEITLPKKVRGLKISVE
ncbi:MAG: Hsp20/alpha crystallin family protein [Candidatus Bathyarchaeota archaeon]